MNFIDHPAFQAGLAPLLAGILAAVLFRKASTAWFAPTIGYAIMVGLTTGYSFTPLSIGRKILLVALIAPVLGLVVDRMVAGDRRGEIILAVLSVAVTPWVFWAVLMQGDAIRLRNAPAIAVFLPLLVLLLSRLRTDGVRLAAAGVGLGLAVGISAFISASIGFLFGGIAMAAACGGLLLMQSLLSINLAAGLVGTASLAWGLGLFAGGAAMLAELPWYVLPLLLLPPLAMLLPLPRKRRRFFNATITLLYALVAAVVPMLAAWFATR